jgi:hypothetical protein
MVGAYRRAGHVHDADAELSNGERRRQLPAVVVRILGVAVLIALFETPISFAIASMVTLRAARAL